MPAKRSRKPAENLEKNALVLREKDLFAIIYIVYNEPNPGTWDPAAGSKPVVWRETMSKYDSFEKMITSLEAICGSFVIKDFVGFLNWEPTLGALLLRHTGHHSAFCQSIKQNPNLYARCSLCSAAHKRHCKQLQAPFSKSCFLGISEYSVPIMIDRLCIGSISVGHTCTDFSEASRRLKKEAERLSLNHSELQQIFHESVSPEAPSSQTCAVFQFIADFLAEEFRPFVHLARLDDAKSPADSGFEAIRTYIFNNYTSPNISIASIAEACNYSQSYVSHTFKKKMKVNVRTYINQLRIVLAKHELSNGSSVSFTAMICGFNDANYFSNVFRSMVGIPPSQYAKHCHKG